MGIAGLTLRRSGGAVFRDDEILRIRRRNAGPLVSRAGVMGSQTNPAPYEHREEPSADRVLILGTGPPVDCLRTSFPSCSHRIVFVRESRENDARGSKLCPIAISAPNALCLKGL